MADELEARADNDALAAEEDAANDHIQVSAAGDVAADGEIVGEGKAHD